VSGTKKIKDWFMQMLKFEKGDDCWIAMGGPKLCKGKVLEILDLKDHGYTFLNYLIEVQTGIDPVLKVRCGWTMSDHPDKQIGMWRRDK
jgi:hypothetical protein